MIKIRTKEYQRETKTYHTCKSLSTIYFTDGFETIKRTTVRIRLSQIKLFIKGL